MSVKDYTIEDLLVPHSEILTNERKNILFLGNGSFAEDEESLKKQKVKFVLTVTRSKPRIDYKSLDITWKHFEDVGDTPDSSIFEIFEGTFQFIEESLEKGNVLVHCDAGQSRSGTVMVAYIMRKMKMSFEEALKFVKTRRKCVDPNEGFMKELKEFEKKLDRYN